MKLSTILDHIDSGHMVLPEFQRGYVWTRGQVRGLYESLYHRYPVGGLLVWVTSSDSAERRGDGPTAAGVVNLLLDGQQRVTTVYGVTRGKPPAFFDGDAKAFTGLHFHLEQETFEFYHRTRMSDDPLWIDVSGLMVEGQEKFLAALLGRLQSKPEHVSRLSDYVVRLNRLHAITDVDLHVDEVTGEDKSIDLVVDIFNRVNSGGTKLSQGDLALAKVSASWPGARGQMKAMLETWNQAGYWFTMDWLLRCVNTVLTGEARFHHLHDVEAADFSQGLKYAYRSINSALHMVEARLGLDHDRVLFSKYAFPVLVRYLDQLNGMPDEQTRDKLLYWYVQTGMLGWFSGSTETRIDSCLTAIEDAEAGPDELIEQLRIWGGASEVRPEHFQSWSRGATCYPVMYMLTRMGAARDWGSGLPIRQGLVGNSLEMHHIFPKSQLYTCDYARPEVNALGNFCFQTQGTNLAISNRLPVEYFPEIEEAHPGALESQWIPMDERLWDVGNYPEFLEACRELLAAETNQRLADLMHGDERWLVSETRAVSATPTMPEVRVIGTINSEEEQVLNDLNNWVEGLGLARGQMEFGYTNAETGVQEAVFDLAWPDGLQYELSPPVAVLLNEPGEVIALASHAGYRCFTDVADFKRYVQAEILDSSFAGQTPTLQGVWT